MSSCPNCGAAVAEDLKFCGYCGTALDVIPHETGTRILQDTQAIRSETERLAQSTLAPTSDSLLNANGYQLVAVGPADEHLFARLTDDGALLWYASDSSGERFIVDAAFVDSLLESEDFPSWVDGTGFARCTTCGSKYHLSRTASPVASGTYRLGCLRCESEDGALKLIANARASFVQSVSDAEGSLGSPIVSADEYALAKSLPEALSRVANTLAGEVRRGEFIAHGLETVRTPVLSWQEWQEWESWRPFLQLRGSELAANAGVPADDLQTEIVRARSVLSESPIERLNDKCASALAAYDLAVSEDSDRWTRIVRILAALWYGLIPGVIVGFAWLYRYAQVGLLPALLMGWAACAFVIWLYLLLVRWNIDGTYGRSR